MQALRCPQCGRGLGAVAIIAVVVLASLWTLPWRSCAPPPTAVRPAFGADGAHPLVSAFLADLWAHSTPSKAGS
jgi:hypothetical protein